MKLQTLYLVGKPKSCLVYRIFFLFLVLFVFYACAASSDAIPVREVAVDEDLKLAGLGIESKDINSISKTIVADLLLSDFYHESKTPPIIVLEGEYFINESSYIINTNLLADRMRVSLIRETKRKLRFVTRQNLQALINEAQTSGSDIDLIQAQYRMTARITSIHGVSNQTGVKSNYFQFSFELLDLQTGSILWANIYDVRKIGGDDTIYR